MKTKTSLLTIISVVAVAAATFTFSKETTSAMAAAFLPWLFLLRLKRRLAQHLVRKRNHSAPPKRGFLHQIVDGIGLGQTRLGVFARRFWGSVALFLATLLCVLPSHPTMTSQTVEFDESNQTVSVTFYDENLDADVHIAAIPIIVGIIGIVGAVASVVGTAIVLHDKYDCSDVDGMVKARTSLETPTMYAWCNHFYAGKLA